MDDPTGPIGPGEVLHLSTAHAKDGQALKFDLESIFARNGFLVEEYMADKLLITPDVKVIELEAMHMGLRKRLAPTAQIEQGVEFDTFDAEARHAFKDVDSPGFFTPAEVSMLTHRLLSYIKVSVSLLTSHSGSANSVIAAHRRQEAVLTSPCSGR